MQNPNRPADRGDDLLTRAQPHYAVFVDADNIAAKYAGKILDEVARFGTPVLRRVYGDWTCEPLAPWVTKVRDLGFVARQESANTKQKNATDIGLVIDAMDVLHSGRFDGFVLVSSDSDFTALANRIREHGSDVIGIGEKKAPASFRNACNHFVVLEADKQNPVNGHKRTSPSEVARDPEDAAHLIVQAMEKGNKPNDWHSLSVVGKQLRTVSESFSVRDYGCSSLSKLISRLDGFETRMDGGHVQVRMST